MVLRKDVACVKPSQTLSLFLLLKLLSLKISLLCTRFLFFFFFVSKYYDVLLNPNPLSSAYRVMNRMNLSHSWDERMMYLASMHFGFPFTNFAFTSTCFLKLLFTVSEFRKRLLENVRVLERETERQTETRRRKHREHMMRQTRRSDDV